VTPTAGPAWSDQPVLVRVPATSANLGPGFDALGLALSLRDDIEARVTPGGLSVEVTGEAAEEGEGNLVVRAMRAAFDSIPGGAQPPGLALRCVNRIPHARGLGSSAAAIVGGVLAAHALAGVDPDALRVLSLASSLEGHPDNVAAALFGGLTIAWDTTDGVRAVHLEPLESIHPVAIIAAEPVSTQIARGLLPDMVPHRDAAFNSGRAALLVAALTADVGGASWPDALLDATADRLHQDYRAKTMPATYELVTRLRAAGIPAVVSGAGPSVLAFAGAGAGADAGTRDQLLTIVGSTGAETGTAWNTSPLDVARDGASIVSKPPIQGSDRDADTSSPGR
jgi:homoserine kinase